MAEVDDQTLILADQSEKATGPGAGARARAAGRQVPPDKADQLARLLSEWTWTHDHPIRFEMAKSYGLPVRSDLPPEFLDLMNYRQPVRRQPTVEYLPQPHHVKGPRRE